MANCTIVYDDPNRTASPGEVRDAAYEAADAGAPFDEDTDVRVGINRGRGEIRITIEDAGEPDEWDESGYLALREALDEVDDLGEVLDQTNAPYLSQRYETAEDTDADTEEPVENGAEIEADAEAETEADLEVDPSELTVDELKDAIADVDDAAVLEAALEAELAGEDRTTAVRALTGRINAVEGEDGASG